jgi:hypothetical protein
MHFKLSPSDPTFTYEGCTKMGKKPLIEVLGENKTKGFAYLNFMKELGRIIEIHKG